MKYRPRLGHLVFVMSVGLVAATSFALHLVLARWMHSGEYAALTACLGFMAIVAVPLGALDAEATKFTASRQECDLRMGKLVRTSVILVTLTALALIAMSGPLSGLLKQRSVLPVIMMAVWMVVAGTGSLANGLVMGKRRFGVGGIANILGNGVVRLVVAIIAVRLGFGVTGVVAASVFGSLVVTAVLLIGMSSLERSRLWAMGHDSARAGQSLLLSQVALVGFWLTFSEMVFVAPHFFGGRIAGSYAASFNFMKVIGFGPSIALNLVYPYLVAAGKRERHRLLSWLIVGTGVVGLILAILLATEGASWARAIYGHQYIIDPMVLFIIGLQLTVISIGGILVFFFLAEGSFAAWSLWCIPIISFLVFELGTHALLSDLVEFLLVSSVVVGAIGISIPLRIRRKLRKGRIGGATRKEHERMGILGWDTGGRDDRLIDLTDLSAMLHNENQGGASGPMVSVVVPFYNPGPERLNRHLKRLSDLMLNLGWSHEIIAVSDGSTDNSNLVVDELNLPSVHLVSLGSNRGKGFAIREGFKRSSGELVAYIDGDGDIAPEILVKLLLAVRDNGARVGVGQKCYCSRWVPHLRPLMSTVYSWLVRMLFHFGIRDTQSGVKVFRNADVNWILDKLECCGFGIDIELLAMLKVMGMLGRVEVVPFEVAARRPTTVNFWSAIAVVMETIHIFNRSRRMRKAQLVLAPSSRSAPVPQPIDRAIIPSEAG